jgi:hypothetical protein
VDSNLIRLIEETVKDDQELEKEFNIYDICQKKKGCFKIIKITSTDKLFSSLDPDSCETTAQVFKCGVESDSKAMTNLVTDSSNILAQQFMVTSENYHLFAYT